MSKGKFITLNSQLNFFNEEGKLQLEKDAEAVREYFLSEVNQNTVFFHNLKEKLNYLQEGNYYEKEWIGMYDFEFIKSAFKKAYGYKFRFPGFLGARIFFTNYALKTDDGKRFLERFEDRVVVTALYLAQGEKQFAEDLITEMMTQVYQPATPTFSNAGRARRGELVSCFLLLVDDDLNSISRSINAALQLSKRGGGVALGLTDVREAGAPIKGMANRAKGLVPIMKMYEDAFSYADQLGTRPGAGAIYVSVHHPDVMAVLDTKRENADEKVRIKTLSVGLVVSDIFWKKWSEGKPYYTFSPYDVKRVTGKHMSQHNLTEMYDEFVANEDIKKTKLDPEEVLQTAALISGESGYPYILNGCLASKVDALNAQINLSNLCSEVLQKNKSSTYNEDLSYDEIGMDISCNLGSLNLVNYLESGRHEQAVDTSMRALSAVSDLSNIQAVPSIANANANLRSVGLGAMNLAGLFGKYEIMYGDEDSIELSNLLFAAINFYSIKSSMQQAIEKTPFTGWEESKYGDGTYFTTYTSKEWKATRPKVKEIFNLNNFYIPTQEDWQELAEQVAKNGLYNAYRMAVPPTGSISYINNATSSVHPIAAQIELREQGQVGLVCYPAPHMTNDNREFFPTAYDVGTEKLIDVYAVIAPHIDQGMSLTVFHKDGATTNDVIRTWAYARAKGCKTVYYARFQQRLLEGTEEANCVSCEL